MTRAVWTWTAVTIVLLFAAWIALSASEPAHYLRSRHSDPAPAAPAIVTVTTDGKLFHRPDCAYIHGTPKTESGTQAIAEGYTACTRCLPGTSAR